MLKNKVSGSVIIASLSLLFSFSVGAEQDEVRIDEIPLYGGMDRSKVEELKKADEEFIADVIKEYGSKEAASQAFVRQGFAYYQFDQLGVAVRRFNQAWLINPDNPEVYHGLASVMYDQGDNCGSMGMFEKGLVLDTSVLNASEAGFLADAAMVISLCALDNSHSKKESQELTEKSDHLFLKAETLANATDVPISHYVYDKWWQALYWRGDYQESWEKVFDMRDAGAEPDELAIDHLKSKMPEPKRE